MNRVVTTIAVLLSLFMAAMESTVVTTAMPTVVADLGGLELYGWVGAIYLLGSTVTMPLFGKLSDLYGRKPLMLIGIALFLVGSMASGLSRSMVELIAFRGLQALGAGGLQTLAFIVAGDIFTTQERARIQGLFGAVWAIAGMSGPLLGGLLVKYLSWRWVFFVNVPIGLLAVALYVGAFHESVVRRPVKLDLLGAAVLSGSVVALLLGTSRVAPALTIPLAIVLGVLFVAVERRVAEPVLPLELLRRRVIALSCALGAVIGATMLSTITYLPLYMQGILGSTPTEAGSAVAPILFGWPIAAAFSGRILGRVTYRTLIIIGWVIATAATAVLAAEVQATASPNVLRVVMFFFGIGLGFANTPLLLVLQESVGWEERGVATAATAFFRTIGGSIAVGGLGAILAASLSGIADPRTISEMMGPDHGRHLDPMLLGHLATQLEGSLVVIFRVIAGLAAMAFALGFFFPPLRMGQGQQQEPQRIGKMGPLTNDLSASTPNRRT